MSGSRLHQASFHPTESAILTNIGRISYSITTGATGKAGDHFSKPDQSSTFDLDYDNNSNSGLCSKETLSMAYSWSSWGISIDQCWITWNNNNWLWLPAYWCYEYGAIDGNSVWILTEGVGVNSYEFVENPKLEDQSTIGRKP